MHHTAPQGLIEHFSKLEAPRVDRNKKHELIDVVVLCVCAVLSGAEGWCDIEEFGRPSQITSRPDLHHLSALFGSREQLVIADGRRDMRTLLERRLLRAQAPH